MTMNRLWNVSNPYQGHYKKVLCVCSAGILRSPTAALVLSQEPFHYNTRAAGCEADYALIPVDKVLLSWADEIVVMEAWQKKHVDGMLEEFMIDNESICLNIPDNFEYRNEDLMQIIKDRYIESIGIV